MCNKEGIAMATILLSVDEIAENYAVDTEKFNSGGV